MRNFFAYRYRALKAPLAFLLFFTLFPLALVAWSYQLPLEGHRSAAAVFADTYPLLNRALDVRPGILPLDALLNYAYSLVMPLLGLAAMGAMVRCLWTGWVRSGEGDLYLFSHRSRAVILWVHALSLLLVCLAQAAFSVVVLFVIRWIKPIFSVGLVPMLRLVMLFGMWQWLTGCILLCIAAVRAQADVPVWMGISLFVLGLLVKFAVISLLDRLPAWTAVFNPYPLWLVKQAAALWWRRLAVWAALAAVLVFLSGRSLESKIFSRLG